MYKARPCFFFMKLPIPKGKEKEISDIQKFIEKKHWNFSSLELRENILRFISVESAINEWSSTIEHEEVRRKYTRSVKNLLLDGKIPANIDPNCSIVSLD